MSWMSILEILVFFPNHALSNPYRFAAGLIEAASAEDHSASRSILQRCNPQDLSELVSTVLLTGTLREDVHAGKTLPEIFSEAGMESLPGACDDGSVRLVLGSVNRVERVSDFDEREPHRLDVRIHLIPLPFYSALLTFNLSSIRAQMGVMISADDPLIVQLRSFFLEDMATKCLVFEKGFPLASVYESSFVDR